MKKHQAFRYALLSQICLLTGLLLCILLKPEQAALDYPVSYFGNFRTTIVPYTAGFLLCAYWLLRTSRILSPEMRLLRRLLFALAACLLGVLCTPYMISITVGYVHLSFAGALLILELCVAVLLIARSHHIYALLGFAVQLAGAILAILSQIALLHLELIGELAIVIGFGILLCYDLRQLDITEPIPETSAETLDN